MLKIFRQPYEKGTLEAWAKICDDITKVAILAIPVIIFNDDPTLMKATKIVLLTVNIYGFAIIGRFCRSLCE